MSSLTRAEQRQLEVIELRLSAEEPDLARLLAPGSGIDPTIEREGRRRKRIAVAVWVTGVIMLTIGSVLHVTALASAGLLIAALAPAASGLRLRSGGREGR